MFTRNIVDYAECVLGFYPGLDMDVVMEDEIKTTLPDGREIVFDKGSRGIIRSFTLESLPSQLTIVIEVFDLQGRSTVQTFTENDAEPQFPFAPPKTQEQIELERAEAAAQAEKEKAEQEKKAREQQEAEARAQAHKDNRAKQERWMDQHFHHGRGYH